VDSIWHQKKVRYQIIVIQSSCRAPMKILDNSKWQSSSSHENSEILGCVHYVLLMYPLLWLQVGSRHEAKLLCSGEML
jgi:hypothetical protein